MPSLPRPRARLTVALAAASLLVPSSALARDLYTSPSGTLNSGAACSAADPCGIGRASLDAGTGDTVHIGPGSYGTQTAPLTYGIGNLNSGLVWDASPGVKLYIHNSDPGSYDSFDVFPGQELRGHGMELHSRDSVGLSISGNATVDRVNVTSSGDLGCLLTSESTTTGAQGVLTNSVCLISGSAGSFPIGLYVASEGHDQTFAVIGTTAVNTQAVGAGLMFAPPYSSPSGAASTLELDLSVASAPLYGLEVAGNASGSHVAKVVARSSALGAVHVDTGGQLDETRGTVHDIVDPGFVEPTSDFHLRANSPLVNQLAGKGPVTPPTVDLDGVTRDPINPEPGAYEYKAPPAPPTNNPGPTPPSGGTPTSTAKCVVPRLKGLSIKTARARLAKAGCKLGKIRGKNGRVTTQTVKAGTVLTAGTTIGVRRAKRAARPA